MFSHFLQLTDISILAKLPEAIERKDDIILKFCLKLNKNVGVQEVLAKYEPNTSQDKAMCIILLLLAYFKEARDANIVQADPSATAADIQRTLSLPSTPRLIVSGEVMKPRAWMLSIEGQVVMGPQANFVNGIAALFVSYYNFNLQYPEEASCTLEFIQRCFVGINPEKGSKAKKQRGGAGRAAASAAGCSSPSPLPALSGCGGTVPLSCSPPPLPRSTDASESASSG